MITVVDSTSGAILADCICRILSSPYTSGASRWRSCEGCECWPLLRILMMLFHSFIKYNYIWSIVTDSSIIIMNRSQYSLQLEFSNNDCGSCS